MTEQNGIRDDLEYNDGLGDLLREKEKLEFSWVKTIVSLCVILTAVYFGVHFLFKFATSIIEDSVSVKYTEQEAPSREIETDAEEVVQAEEQERAMSYTAPEPPKVEKAVVAPSKPAVTTEPKKAHPFKVVAGSFVNKHNAVTLQKQLEAKGFSAYVWAAPNTKGEMVYRVQAGAFETRSLAKNRQQALKKKGYDSYILQK